MSVTVHAIYPISQGSTFDYEHFESKHLPLVRTHFGPHGLIGLTASRGLAGGPDIPPAYHAITMMTFSDEASMQAALDAAKPVLADIPNYTNSEVALLIGKIIG